MVWIWHQRAFVAFCFVSSATTKHYREKASMVGAELWLGYFHLPQCMAVFFERSPE
jgi:hypothetical protein